MMQKELPLPGIQTVTLATSLLPSCWDTHTVLTSMSGCETWISHINNINHTDFTWATASTVLLRQQLYRQCTIFAQQ